MKEKSSAADPAISLYVGIILVGANLRAPITSIGPVLSDIQKDLHLSSSLAGLLNALPLIVFAVTSLFAPVLGRRYGLEKLLGASIGLILLGSLARSIRSYGAVWYGTSLLSLGIGLGNVLLPALVKRDFPNRAAGLIGSYAASMAAAAGLSAGLAVPISQIDGLGWRWSTGIWALLTFATLLIWSPQFRAKQSYLGPAALAEARAISPWRHPIGWQVSLFFAFHSMIFYSLVD